VRANVTRRRASILVDLLSAQESFTGAMLREIQFLFREYAGTGSTLCLGERQVSLINLPADHAELLAGELLRLCLFGAHGYRVMTLERGA
jgi:hypothetical protein